VDKIANVINAKMVEEVKNENVIEWKDKVY